MAHDDDDDRNSGHTGALFRGGLMALGAVAALWFIVFPLLGLGFVLLKNAIFFGALAGAGYLGYRALTGGSRPRAVSGGRHRRALPAGRGRSSGSGDDFDRKMRELEAIEKRLDAEIGKR